jgi:hypothetical protein
MPSVLQIFHSSLTASERSGDAEALADSTDGTALQRRVTRNWRLCPIRRIHPDVVTTAVMVKETAAFG